MVGDLVKLCSEDTLLYDPCKDESQNAEMFSVLDEEPELTLEWRNQYVNAEILLPREDRMARV